MSIRDSALQRQSVVERIQKKLALGSTLSDHVPEVSRGIFLYGAGELGVLALEYCAACKIEVIGVVDKSKSGARTFGDGVIDISSPNQSSIDKFKSIPIFVAIANTPVQPIIDSLKSQRWRHVFPFYALTSTLRAGHPLSNGWLIQGIDGKEIDDVREICEVWCDDASLEHYESFIDWHLDFTESLPQIEPILPAQRYLIDSVRFAIGNRRGQLVDVGSHLGQMPRRLINAGFDFHEYVLVEPDTLNRQRLEIEVRDFMPPSAKVTILADLLASKIASSNFAEGLGYCSQVWSKSELSRITTKLDDLQLNPDLLKIHTEGTEFDILQGGLKTILKSRPVVLFTTYHNRDGLSRSIAGSMRMFPNYSWSFRLHSFQGTGAVVYGFPDERNS